MLPILRRLVPFSSGFLGKMNNLINCTLDGDFVGKQNTRLCVFASFSIDGHVNPLALLYLKAIKAEGFDIVFVQASDSPSDKSSYSMLSPLCRKIINRRNVGYDFVSWKEGLKSIPELMEYESLLLTNDSIIGPFAPLKPIFESMDADPEALWGLTDCHETGTHHLQSYFIYCSRQVFSKRFFSKFWDRMKILHQKWQIVLKYEVGLSKAAIAAGVPIKAKFGYHDIERICLARGKRFQFWSEIRKDRLNPTLFAWDILLEELKYPFIKSELLRSNRLNLRHINQWLTKVDRSHQELVDAALKFEFSSHWPLPSRRGKNTETSAAPNSKNIAFRLSSRVYRRLDHRRDQLRRFVKDLRRGDAEEILRKLSKIKLLAPYLGRFRKGSGISPAAPSHRELYFIEAHRELILFLKSRDKIRVPYSLKPKVTVILILYNKAELTLRCVRSLAKLKGEPFNLVIIDNASTDETQKLLKRIEGATIVKNSVNEGFLKACNQAAKLVTTEHILFLNNDTTLNPGSIKVGVEVLNDELVGAVGGRVILPDGTLQEAGNILWNDGTCVGFGRGLPQDADVCMHQRSVDYCSGVFLMTRADLFREIGGFDDIFAPAYYEETDYCAQIQSRGLKIIYDPRISLTHVEFGSSDRPTSAFDLMERNRERFLEKNSKLLSTKAPPGTAPHLVNTLRCGKLRWLFLDDRVALPHIGAGYPRMNRIIHLVEGLGDFDITVACTEHFIGDWHQIRQSIPIGIEVLNLTDSTRREQFIKQRLGEFDVVWISRPSNMDHIAKTVPPECLAERKYVLIYDSEAIFADRAIAEAETFSLSTEFAKNLRKVELANGALADIIVAVCDSDAEQWRKQTRRPVIVVGHDAPVMAGPKNFTERKDILFVGSLHGMMSPNVDSLFWFMGQVMPILQRKLPDITLRAIGYIDGGLKAQIGSGRRNFELVGSVQDFRPYLTRHRLVVVPTRFAAGIPQKVFDAAVTGIPTVCSPLIASQMGWRDEVETLVGDIRDPEHFAEQCFRLYTDETLWNHVYQQSLESMRVYARKHTIEKGVQQVKKEIQRCTLSTSIGEEEFGVGAF